MYTGRMQPYATDAALKEKWMTLVDTNPDTWLKDVDPWFLSGESPSPTGKTEYIVKPAKISKFNSINAVGDFTVQVVGGQPGNSVYIYGPKDSVDSIVVEVFKNSLNIHQTNASASLKDVVVRVGVHQLRNLTNSGNGLILGRTIISKQLTVNASGTGSIYLGGKMNLKEVTQTGSGTITLIGAESPALNVLVKGNGNVNISGKVGIENIVHDGDGCLSIIGADSDGVCITTAGNGVTSIFGYMNLREVVARDSSRLFVLWVYSKHVNVRATDQAVVGLAGTAAKMNIELDDNACFQGEYMRSCVLYIKTQDDARANVAADLKIYATTGDSSYIYYFGSPNILTSFNSLRSTIIPLGNYLTPTLRPPTGVFQPPSFCATCES